MAESRNPGWMVGMIKGKPTTSVEHLDFDLECDACKRVAEATADSHGHKTEIVCFKCVEIVYEQFITRKVLFGSVQCTDCVRFFTRFSDMFTVRPL